MTVLYSFRKNNRTYNVNECVECGSRFTNRDDYKREKCIPCGRKRSVNRKPNPQNIKVIDGQLYVELEQVPNYWVGTDGRIIGIKGSYLACPPNGRGYSSFAAKTLKGSINSPRVHRCVAETFLPNFNQKEQINHIDGNKANNAVSNLEWCTNQENAIHAVKTGLRS